MIVPSQLALKTHTNFGCAATLATLDKLVDRFPLLPIAPPIGDTSLTHVMRLGAHSTNNDYCDGTIIYNDLVYLLKCFLKRTYLVFNNRKVTQKLKAA
jgi:hypothetical protein